ncbi:hypothetical protein GCM10009740_03500 [Terrabacter terrae]|uniref:Tight adherence protein B n=1 Tax=Terrabacter terrae TaxID=318434 RepID=A0ABN2TT25_9MICO
MTAQGAVLAASALAAAASVAAAVLLWPRRRSAVGAFVDAWSVPVPGHGSRGPARVGSLWHEDPVDLYRRWRLRRRPGVLVDDVLELLRGIGPALEAGLTPSRAIDLAATSTLGAERVAAARGAVRAARASRRSPSGRSGADGDDAPAADIDRLVGDLLEASDRAAPTSPVWAGWAERSASADLRLVAAAWRLSETTGAPLASAVDRAARGLLDARTRRGKVAVAVAGPRATVTVLTLLPLTGPLFGLACGVDPAGLYLGSPLAAACATVGLGLVWSGRVWCARLVRRAVGR